MTEPRIRANEIRGKILQAQVEAEPFVSILVKIAVFDQVRVFSDGTVMRQTRADLRETEHQAREAIAVIYRHYFGKDAP